MKVTLIGAGPYDKGLMTIAGMEALQEADVVLYDKLVGEEIISLIPPKCEKINVGKSMGNHSVAQSEINQILLNKALKGLNVVRLKGGDPFLFGRGGEELELLVENNVPFRVIPGVTSSISVPSYAGIPVTHREYSSSLHIITGHLSEEKKYDIDFKTLAKLKGTLIFMMGVKAMPNIFLELIQAGMDANTPAAIVENGTSSMQRKFVGNLKTLPEISEKNCVKSPSVIIVGDVCKLSDKFDWFSKMPLHGNKIIVTRVNQGVGKLAKSLKNLGADILEVPMVKTTPSIEYNPEILKSLENINEYNWLVFTSAIGVNIFFDYLINIKFDYRKLNHLKIAVVGKETERELSKRGLLAEFVPKEYNSEVLGLGLCNLVKPMEKILILRAKKGTKELTDLLDKQNIDYKNIDIYETEIIENNGNTINNILKQNPETLVTFTSASTVEGFVNFTKWENYNGIRAICIGERTACLAKSFGFKTYVSENATIDSMVEKICNMVTTK